MGPRAVLDTVVVYCLLSYCGGEIRHFIRKDFCLNIAHSVLIIPLGIPCTERPVVYLGRLHYDVIMRRIFEKFRRSTVSQVLSPTGVLLKGRSDVDLLRRPVFYSLCFASNST
jgi:hypothetical protein